MDLNPTITTTPVSDSDTSRLFFVFYRKADRPQHEVRIETTDANLIGELLEKNILSPDTYYEFELSVETVPVAASGNSRTFIQ